jgi:hypothetical protein
MLEESVEEPEMEPEPVPEVVPKEVPVEGAMIAVRAVAPSPPRGASTASSPAPRVATAAGAIASAALGLEVILGHPHPLRTGRIPLDETMNTAHRALS